MIDLFAMTEYRPVSSAGGCELEPVIKLPRGFRQRKVTSTVLNLEMILPKAGLAVLFAIFLLCLFCLCWGERGREIAWLD